MINYETLINMLEAYRLGLVKEVNLCAKDHNDNSMAFFAGGVSTITNIIAYIKEHKE